MLSNQLREILQRIVNDADDVGTSGVVCVSEGLIREAEDIIAETLKTPDRIALQEGTVSVYAQIKFDVRFDACDYREGELRAAILSDLEFVPQVGDANFVVDSTEIVSDEGDLDFENYVGNDDCDNKEEGEDEHETQPDDDWPKCDN